ncbi:MAG: hypothetical protein H0W77_10675 [Acidobacteria bacterium]|jgi:hypothetical protein|nr:hypothetical protein [Acidobacteriota bacterium]HEV8158661.1 hypothetical protein [Pyrinomonadaceae bacterium]
MKKFLSAAFGAYRKYRAFTKRSKTYKAVKYSLVKVFAAYGNFTLPFRLCMQRAAQRIIGCEGAGSNFVIRVVR